MVKYNVEKFDISAFELRFSRANTSLLKRILISGVKIK